MGGKKKEWTTSIAVCVRAALKKDAGCEHAHPRTFSPYEEDMLKTHTPYGKVLYRWEGQTPIPGLRLAQTMSLTKVVLLFIQV